MTPDSDTGEFDESTGEVLKTFTVRLPEELVERLKVRTDDVGLSRNAWLTKCVEWVLTYLPTGVQNPERGRIAMAAPADVAGTKQVRIIK